MATLDRETLYKQVWTVPGIQLALKYGISDVALSKACRRHKIPRPPRGYWARIQAGQRIPRPPLPKIDNARLQSVHIYGANMTAGNSDGAEAPDRAPRDRILVGPVLTAPHPLVESAYQQLTSAEPGPGKIVKTDPRTAVDVRVRAETIDRAVRVFDAFAKAWEQEAGRIVPGECNKVPCTLAALGDDLMMIHLTETTDPVRRGRRAADTPAAGANPRLCFVVGDGRLDGIKGTWADTTTVRLEKMLRPLIDAIRDYLNAHRQIRLDQECEQRQQEAAQAVRQAKADEVKQEFYLRQQLLGDVDRWRRAQEIREYLTMVRKRIEANEIRPRNPVAARAWLEWATWFANDMDPVGQAPPRERAAIAPKNTPVAELDLTSRSRALVAQLGVKDTDELLLVTDTKVHELSGWSSGMWRELTLVLEGLGYEVGNRKSSYYY